MNAREKNLEDARKDFDEADRFHTGAKGAVLEAKDALALAVGKPGQEAAVARHQTAVSIAEGARRKWELAQVALDAAQTAYDASRLTDAKAQATSLRIKIKAASDALDAKLAVVQQEAVGEAGPIFAMAKELAAIEEQIRGAPVLPGVSGARWSSMSVLGRELDLPGSSTRREHLEILVRDGRYSVLVDFARGKLSFAEAINGKCEFPDADEEAGS